jgi:crossover junction endodeoxyribonuclease RuvC
MARKSSRTLWAEKLAGKNTGKSKSVVLPNQGLPFKGTVLGIDPSLRGTGLAVVHIPSQQKQQLLESRTLKLASRIDFVGCLGEIHKAVADLLEKHPITHVAIEGTIYVQNFQTAQTMGASRGAAISAVALKNLPVFEYAPLRIKQAVVGYGRASKEQVANQTKGILQLQNALAFDEADAAAVALCHAFTWRSE